MDELELIASEALAACDGVLARLWTMGPGDLCATCPMLPECPDQTRCLHLVASAGTTTRIDGPFRRFPIGARRVGQVAATHEPYVARDQLDQLQELADVLWLGAHGVKSFAAVSLEHAGECLGVLAVFSRRVLSDGEVALLALAARLAARASVVAERARAAAARGATEAIVNEPPSGASPGSKPARGAGRRAPAHTLADLQREAIERTLVETRGRISGPNGAAKLLGLKPSTLVSRMQKLGVKRPRR